MAVLISVGSCRYMSNFSAPQNLREQYVRELAESPIAKNPLLQRWHHSADSALTWARQSSLPTQRQLFFFTDEPHAWGWKLPIAEGRHLRVHIVPQDTSHTLFTELFRGDGAQSQLLAATTDSVLTYEASHTDTLLLRVQPALFITGSAIVSITDAPTMAFPVSDGQPRDIGSIWGDPRDGGRRKHEGIDIFAARGTPVIAAGAGRVSRTGNRGLGGKQVWLRTHGKALYYAHLDSIDVAPMQNVQRGDTLGFVGNTGNARTTPPHLHFGIYRQGAINPLPFVKPPRTIGEPLRAIESPNAKWMRINNHQARLRAHPSPRSQPISQHDRNTPVRLISSGQGWHEIALPNGQHGFMLQSQLSSIAPSLGQASLQKGVQLYAHLTDTTSFATLQTPLRGHLIGNYKEARLVRFNNGFSWVK